MLAAALAMLAISGCGGDPPADPVLHKIKARGQLVVLTRNAPTTYYEGNDGRLAGMEHDMAVSFAKSLGVAVRFKVLDSVADILSALKKGEGDLAAAGLTRTIGRAGKFRFGPTYQQVREQVICRRGGRQPKSVAGLPGLKLVVAAESSYVERLANLKTRYPKLSWQVSRDDDTEQLLEDVWKRQIDCTVADSEIVAINRRYYPELTIAFDLGQPQPLAWVLPRDAGGLQRAVEHWFAKFRKSGRLAALKTRYYGYVRIFDYVDTVTYVRRIRKRLPRYEALFKQVASKTGINWTLLAAQSYQESHWNPRARSPTGVLGMMMLTRSTASQLGVSHRLNPAQSIRGGARYLAELRERLPADLHEPLRTWLALAAYNLGLGHIQDALKLDTRLHDKDPATWGSISKVLPLLAKHRYYHHLEHGYARGNEAVRYVNRIRYYQDILHRKVQGGG
ncbi:MAG: membrane-bound lytic murein transglycosylase MltF [Gammaproteobacteria bacterium]